MGYVLEDNKVRFVYDKTTDLDIDAISIEDLSGKYTLVQYVNGESHIKCPGCGYDLPMKGDADFLCAETHIVVTSGMVYVEYV